MVILIIRVVGLYRTHPHTPLVVFSQVLIVTVFNAGILTGDTRGRVTLGLCFTLVTSWAPSCCHLVWTCTSDKTSFGNGQKAPKSDVDGATGKSGKSPNTSYNVSHVGIASQHVSCAHPVVYVMQSLLLSICIRHLALPHDLLEVISIPQYGYENDRGLNNPRKYFNRLFGY